MHNEAERKILREYQRTVCKIEDFLEYSYRSHDAQGIRDRIMKEVDDLTERIKLLAKPPADQVSDSNPEQAP